MNTILLAAALLGADAKEDLLASIRKLAEAPSYAWTSTGKNNAPDAGGGQGGRRMTPGAGEGKTEKDGATWLSVKMGETAVEGAIKGDKTAVKSAEGWKAASEFQAGGGQGRPDPAMFMARSLRAWKSPAVTAENLANKAKEIKADGDGVFSAELSEEGVKEQLAGGGRPGGRAPEVAEPKGSVKFWVKDGVLQKFETTVSGKVKFGQRETAIDRTSTVEIKDVGTAKVELPDDAKAKLQ